MADSKQKRGKADRARVSGNQGSEAYYVARKFRVSAGSTGLSILMLSLRESAFVVANRSKADIAFCGAHVCLCIPTCRPFTSLRQRIGA